MEVEEAYEGTAPAFANSDWDKQETIIQKLLVFERKILRIFGPTKEKLGFPNEFSEATQYETEWKCFQGLTL
jgi:hypothetical protein